MKLNIRPSNKVKMPKMKATMGSMKIGGLPKPRLMKPKLSTPHLKPTGGKFKFGG